MKNVFMTLAILSPFALVAWRSSQIQNFQQAEATKKLKDEEERITEKNLWNYLQFPVNTRQAISGDLYENNLVNPSGPVQLAMESQGDNYIGSMKIMAQHEMDKDKAVISSWDQFVRPTREVAYRTQSLPVTTVNLMGGNIPQITSGIKFFDAPFPRQLGTDRYYARETTVPWYLTP